MATAERKAWDSLSRYKFLMFGYHAAQWVTLRSVLTAASGYRTPNPWCDLVGMARATGRSVTVADDPWKGRQWRMMDRSVSSAQRPPQRAGGGSQGHLGAPGALAGAGAREEPQSCGSPRTFRPKTPQERE